MAENANSVLSDSQESISSDDKTVAYSPSSTPEDEAQKVEKPKFTYYVTDFDYCRLAEFDCEKSKECSMCRKEKNKRIKTYLMCCGCNIPCCPKCYDRHRREQLILALRTFRQGCPAHVVISMSDCGGLLEVKRRQNKNKVVAVSTNNPVCDASCKRVKEKAQRKISPVTKQSRSSNVLNFIKNNMKKHRKPLITCQVAVSANNIKLFTTFLERKYGVSTEVLYDNHRHFKCLYLQDGHMKDFFNFYPELICVDVTCKIVEMEVMLYLLLCDDSNGQSAIISACLVATEDAESLAWIFNMFKKHNPNWRKTKIIVADKCIERLDIIKKSFPETSIIVCFFHALKKFRKEISDKELGTLTNEQQKAVSELFVKLLQSGSEEDYQELHKQIRLLLSTSVVGYSEEKWDQIKEDWRIKILYNGEDVLCSLSSFLECIIERRLRPVISRQISLEGFGIKLFLILNLLRIERNQKVDTILQTAPVSLYSKFSPHYEISKLLTPYAAEFVIHQLDLSAELKNINEVAPEKYEINTLGRKVTTSSTVCSCKFYSLMLLPCCHIFAVRNALSLRVFDDALCDYHWTNKYYHSSYLSLQESNADKISNLDIKQQSQEEIFKISTELTDQLLPILLECPQEVFEHRIDCLLQLSFAWKDNEGEAFLQFDGVEFATNNELSEKDVPTEARISNLRQTTGQNSFKENIGSDSETSISSTSSGKLNNKFQNVVDCKPEVNLLPDTLQLLQPRFYCDAWNFDSKLLDGDKITFVYLTRIICKTKQSCIEWLQHMGFLQKRMICPSCSCEMRYRHVVRLSDGAIWICKRFKENKKRCEKRCTIRRGTWFEGTNMTLEQLLMFTYMWIHGFSQQQIISELGMSSATYIVWNKFYRRVCEEVLRTKGNQDTVKKGFNKTKVCSSKKSTAIDLWLQLNVEEDIFLQFLKDAAYIHDQDCAENSESS